MEIRKLEISLLNVCFGFEAFASYVLVGTAIAAIFGKVHWLWPVGIFLAMAAVLVYIIKCNRADRRAEYSNSQPQ